MTKQQNPIDKTAYRITLDLTNFFQDHRKKAFVNIRPEFKNIESLQTRIINLFGFEHYIYLTNVDGVLLPAGERTDVILPDEVIVVHKISLDKLMEPNPVICDTSSDETVQKDVEFINDIKACFIDKHGTMNLTKAPPSALTDVPAKRKRKRVRKRKTKTTTVNENDPKPSTSKQNGHTKPADLWSSDTKNVHVRFSDNASNTSENDSSDEESVSKVCKYADLNFVDPRRLRLLISFWDSRNHLYRQPVEEETQSSELSFVTPPDIPSQVTERPAIPNLRLENIPSSFIGPTIPSNDTNIDQLTEAEIPCVAKPVETPTTANNAGPDSDTLEELRKEIDSLNLPVVDNATIKISDTIAFKLLRMDDQCQPTVSDYIIGCVEKVNENRSELTLKLLAGKSEIGSRICTTVLTDDNEIGVVEKDHIDVAFKELYEPRYCLFTA